MNTKPAMAIKSIIFFNLFLHVVFQMWNERKMINHLKDVANKHTDFRSFYEHENRER